MEAERRHAAAEGQARSLATKKMEVFSQLAPSESRLHAARRAEAAAEDALEVLLQHHDDLLNELQSKCLELLQAPLPSHWSEEQQLDHAHRYLQPAHRLLPFPSKVSPALLSVVYPEASPPPESNPPEPSLLLKPQTHGLVSSVDAQQLSGRRWVECRAHWCSSALLVAEPPDTPVSASTTLAKSSVGMSGTKTLVNWMLTINELRFGSGAVGSETLSSLTSPFVSRPPALHLQRWAATLLHRSGVAHIPSTNVINARSSGGGWWWAQELPPLLPSLFAWGSEIPATSRIHSFPTSLSDTSSDSESDASSEVSEDNDVGNAVATEIDSDGSMGAAVALRQLPNKLAAHRVLCPFELHGNCNDHDCKYQHLRDLLPQDTAQNVTEALTSKRKKVGEGVEKEKETNKRADSGETNELEHSENDDLRQEETGQNCEAATLTPLLVPVHWSSPSTSVLPSLLSLPCACLDPVPLEDGPVERRLPPLRLTPAATPTTFADAAGGADASSASTKPGRTKRDTAHHKEKQPRGQSSATPGSLTKKRLVDGNGDETSGSGTAAGGHVVKKSKSSPSNEEEVSLHRSRIPFAAATSGSEEDFLMFSVSATLAAAAVVGLRAQDEEDGTSVSHDDGGGGSDLEEIGDTNPDAPCEPQDSICTNQLGLHDERSQALGSSVDETQGSGTQGSGRRLPENQTTTAQTALAALEHAVLKQPRGVLNDQKDTASDSLPASSLLPTRFVVHDSWLVAALGQLTTAAEEAADGPANVDVVRQSTSAADGGGVQHGGVGMNLSADGRVSGWQSLASTHPHDHADGKRDLVERVVALCLNSGESRVCGGYASQALSSGFSTGGLPPVLGAAAVHAASTLAAAPKASPALNQSALEKCVDILALAIGERTGQSRHSCATSNGIDVPSSHGSSSLPDIAGSNLPDFRGQQVTLNRITNVKGVSLTPLGLQMEVPPISETTEGLFSNTREETRIVNELTATLASAAAAAPAPSSASAAEQTVGASDATTGRAPCKSADEALHDVPRALAVEHVVSVGRSSECGLQLPLDETRGKRNQRTSKRHGFFLCLGPRHVHALERELLGQGKRVEQGEDPKRSTKGQQDMPGGDSSLPTQTDSVPTSALPVSGFSPGVYFVDTSSTGTWINGKRAVTFVPPVARNTEAAVGGGATLSLVPELDKGECGDNDPQNSDVQSPPHPAVERATTTVLARALEGPLKVGWTLAFGGEERAKSAAAAAPDPSEDDAQGGALEGPQACIGMRFRIDALDEITAVSAPPRDLEVGSSHDPAVTASSATHPSSSVSSPLSSLPISMMPRTVIRKQSALPKGQTGAGRAAAAPVAPVAVPPVSPPPKTPCPPAVHAWLLYLRLFAVQSLLFPPPPSSPSASSPSAPSLPPELSAWRAAMARAEASLRSLQACAKAYTSDHLVVAEDSLSQASSTRATAANTLTCLTSVFVQDCYNASAKAFAACSISSLPPGSSHTNRPASAVGTLVGLLAGGLTEFLTAVADLTVAWCEASESRPRFPQFKDALKLPPVLSVAATHLLLSLARALVSGGFPEVAAGVLGLTVDASFRNPPKKARSLVEYFLCSTPGGQALGPFATSKLTQLLRSRAGYDGAGSLCWWRQWLRPEELSMVALCASWVVASGDLPPEAPSFVGCDEWETLELAWPLGVLNGWWGSSQPSPVARETSSVPISLVLEAGALLEKGMSIGLGIGHRDGGPSAGRGCVLALGLCAVELYGATGHRDKALQILRNFHAKESGHTEFSDIEREGCNTSSGTVALLLARHRMRYASDDEEKKKNVAERDGVGIEMCDEDDNHGGDCDDDSGDRRKNPEAGFHEWPTSSSMLGAYLRGCHSQRIGRRRFSCFPVGSTDTENRGGGGTEALFRVLSEPILSDPCSSHSTLSSSISLSSPDLEAFRFLVNRKLHTWASGLARGGQQSGLEGAVCVDSAVATACVCVWLEGVLACSQATAASIGKAPSSVGSDGGGGHASRRRAASAALIGTKAGLLAQRHALDEALSSSASLMLLPSWEPSDVTTTAFRTHFREHPPTPRIPDEDWLRAVEVEAEEALSQVVAVGAARLKLILVKVGVEVDMAATASGNDRPRSVLVNKRRKSKKHKVMAVNAAASGGGFVNMGEDDGYDSGDDLEGAEVSAEKSEGDSSSRVADALLVTVRECQHCFEQTKKAAERLEAAIAIRAATSNHLPNSSSSARREGETVGASVDGPTLGSGALSGFMASSLVCSGGLSLVLKRCGRRCAHTVAQALLAVSGGGRDALGAEMASMATLSVDINADISSSGSSTVASTRKAPALAAAASVVGWSVLSQALAAASTECWGHGHPLLVAWLQQWAQRRPLGALTALELCPSPLPPSSVMPTDVAPLGGGGGGGGDGASMFEARDNSKARAAALRARAKWNFMALGSTWVYPNLPSTSSAQSSAPLSTEPFVRAFTSAVCEHASSSAESQRQSLPTGGGSSQRSPHQSGGLGRRSAEEFGKSMEGTVSAMRATVGLVEACLSTSPSSSSTGVRPWGSVGEGFLSAEVAEQVEALRCASQVELGEIGRAFRCCERAATSLTPWSCVAWEQLVSLEASFGQRAGDRADAIAKASMLRAGVRVGLACPGDLRLRGSQMSRAQTKGMEEEERPSPMQPLQQQQYNEVADGGEGAVSLLLHLFASNGDTELDLSESLLYPATNSGTSSATASLPAASVFPVSVLFCPNMRALDLSWWGICSVPAVIGSPRLGLINSLAVLNLAHNYLEIVPSAIGSLRCLKELDLSHNALSALTEQLSRCISLEDLALDANRLQDLPSFVTTLVNLRSLGLSHNPLTPSSIPLGLSTALPKLSELRV